MGKASRGTLSHDSGRWLGDYVMIPSSNVSASGYNNTPFWPQASEFLIDKDDPTDPTEILFCHSGAIELSNWVSLFVTFNR